GPPAVAFDHDGARLASAGGILDASGGAFVTGELRVWETASGKEVLAVRGHAAPIVGVAFSPDGRRLASAGMDSAVKLWDATFGQQTLTLTGHDGLVTAVAFSPDGTRLATASVDRTVRVWGAGPADEGPERENP